MPNALKKQSTPEVSPVEEFDDEFGSPEEIAALMVEAFTMPMASDLVDEEEKGNRGARPDRENFRQ
jgi:hypothetical protein